MPQVVDTLIIGGTGAPLLSTFFPYIHGVLSVRKGKTVPAGEPIIEVSYDTLEINSGKLLSIALASTLVDPNAKMAIFGRSIKTLLSEELILRVGERIDEKRLSEFNFEENITPIPVETVAILAKPNEARIFQATDEGARKTLHDTKRALLNLLEDAREAEEKIRNQAESLTVALERERALAEARANFISTASHQLRTPLTTMRWFSEMLDAGDAGELPNEAREYVKQLDQGIARMIDLVNFLLRSARVESRRVSINPKPVHIREAIEGAIDTLKSSIDNKAQTVELTCDDDPVISLDPEFFKEVAVNLISNANLYGGQGTPIKIAITGDEQDVHVTIKDLGIPIKPADRDRVFEKFFRSADAVVASPDGSGLGLAYVREIVHQWGGEITFTSGDGNETTFSFNIPKRGMEAREGEVELVD